MKQNDKGFVAIDMTVAIIAVLIFSSLIITLITSNVLANLKLKNETLAIIYMTEFFENIGIADYEDVTQEKISLLIPEESKEEFTITANVEDIINENKNEYIIKKITANISYEIRNKSYSFSMSRTKIKE